MNTTTVIGNITRDPELTYTPSGTAVCKFALAVNRRFTNRGGEKVDRVAYFDVTAWRDLAENLAQSLAAGSRVVVVGRLDQDRWENDAGEKRSKVHIVADEVSPSLRFATAEVTKAARSVTETSEDEMASAMAGG